MYLGLDFIPQKTELLFTEIFGERRQFDKIFLIVNHSAIKVFWQSKHHSNKIETENEFLDEMRLWALLLVYSVTRLSTLIPQFCRHNDTKKNGKSKGFICLYHKIINDISFLVTVSRVKIKTRLKIQSQFKHWHPVSVKRNGKRKDDREFLFIYPSTLITLFAETSVVFLLNGTFFWLQPNNLLAGKKV